MYSQVKKPFLVFLHRLRMIIRAIIGSAARQAKHCEKLLLTPHGCPALYIGKNLYEVWNLQGVWKVWKIDPGLNSLLPLQPSFPFPLSCLLYMLPGLFISVIYNRYRSCVCPLISLFLFYHPYLRLFSPKKPDVASWSGLKVQQAIMTRALGKLQDAENILW